MPSWHQGSSEEGFWTGSGIRHDESGHSAASAWATWAGFSLDVMTTGVTVPPVMAESMPARVFARSMPSWSAVIETSITACRLSSAVIMRSASKRSANRSGVILLTSFQTNRKRSTARRRNRVDLGADLLEMGTTMLNAEKYRWLPGVPGAKLEPFINSAPGNEIETGQF